MATEIKKLVLVDAYSLLFRAHFANPYLSTADGRPTGALFGFSNMLLSLLNNHKPDSVVICWDGPQRTHRKEEFEAYKAHRPEVDPQLVLQMQPARTLVEAFGIQSAEVPGYEADDLIGTLSVRGHGLGMQVVILTGDSDQLQLVQDGVTVEICQRGVTDVKQYDTEAVTERYGIPPTRLPDWKGLVGDTSDNIPGVPGIGEKTATALLQKWGDMETLLDHLPDVMPNKARISLEANIDVARLSKRLATIVCDAPLDLDVKPYAPTAEDWHNVRALFDDLRFKSLLTRLPRVEVAPVVVAPTPTNVAGTLGNKDLVFDFDADLGDEGPAGTEIAKVADVAGPGKVVLIQDNAAFEQAVREVHAAGSFALVVQTSPGPALRATVTGAAIAISPSSAWYVSVRAADAANETGGLFDAQVDEGDSFAISGADLGGLFDPEQLTVTCHHCKPMLQALSNSCPGAKLPRIAFDTMLAAYLLDSGRSNYPIEDLADTYLPGRALPDATSEPHLISGRQASTLFALKGAMEAKLAEFGMQSVMEGVELPLAPVLAEVEKAGLLVDRGYLMTLSVRLNRDMIALATEIYSIAGEEFNIGSPKQLQVVLFEKLQLPTGKKTKTGYSTGADLLDQLAIDYPIAKKIIDYREISKLKATYADALVKLMDPQTGRVHTTLNQTVASTGRLSSSDPNLQNIPVRSELGREIRRAFIAPSGRVLLSCDYSQIELRILAHMSGDPALTEAFQQNADVHAATASRVFGVPLDAVTIDQRRQAKTINFAVIYGQSAFALATTLGVDNKTAGTWIKEYFNRLPGVQQFITDTTAQAHANRYVSTLLGRRRYLPELDSPNHSMRQFAERAAVNMPIQGTAADIMKLAMIEVYHEVEKHWSGPCRLLLQVHDELLFEVDEAAVPDLVPVIRGIMESVYPLSVPLTADAKSGPNWADMKGLA